MRALRRAAKLRDASGWAGLGYAHLYGAGVAQSDEMAAKSLCMAAQHGHLDAIFNLGVLWLQATPSPDLPRPRPSSLDLHVAMFIVPARDSVAL